MTASYIGSMWFAFYLVLRWERVTLTSIHWLIGLKPPRELTMGIISGLTYRLKNRKLPNDDLKPKTDRQVITELARELSDLIATADATPMQMMVALGIVINETVRECLPPQNQEQAIVVFCDLLKKGTFLTVTSQMAP